MHRKKPWGQTGVPGGWEQPGAVWFLAQWRVVACSPRGLTPLASELKTINVCCGSTGFGQFFPAARRGVHLAFSSRGFVLRRLTFGESPGLGRRLDCMGFSVDGHPRTQVALAYLGIDGG